MYDFVMTDAGNKVIDSYAAWYAAYGYVCLVLGIMILSICPLLWRKKVEGPVIVLAVIIGMSLCIVGFPAFESPRAEAIHYIVKEMKQTQPETTP